MREDTDLALAPRETVSIIGRNGAGQTTLRTDRLTDARLNDVGGPLRGRLEPGRHIL